MKKHHLLLVLLILSFLAGCHTPSRKEKYAEAAKEALEKGIALREEKNIDQSILALKEAERLGLLAGDSLTVAKAQHTIAWQMLNNQHTISEDTTSYYAITLLENADVFYRDDYENKSKVQSLIAMFYCTLKNFEKSEEHIKLGVDYANISNSNTAKRFAWRYYSVICQSQEKYIEAIDCLRNIIPLTPADEISVVEMDIASAFYNNKELDSATYYFHRLESAIPWDNYGDEFRIAAYRALGNFYESLGNPSIALKYRKKQEGLFYEFTAKNAKRSIYDIQQKYDFASLENQMNQKIVYKQRIIMIISILLLVSVALILILQLKQKQILQQEAEVKKQLDALKSKMMTAAFIDEPICRQILETVENQVFKTKVDCIIYKAFALNQNQLAALREAVENHFASFSTNLQQRYPELTNDDLNYCYLYLLGLNEAQISALMQKSYTAVSDRSRKLRKIFGTDQTPSVTLRNMTQK